MIFET